MVRDQITYKLGKPKIDWPVYGDDGDENYENNPKTLIGTINNFFLYNAAD